MQNKQEALWLLRLRDMRSLDAAEVQYSFIFPEPGSHDTMIQIGVGVQVAKTLTYSIMC